MTAADERFLRRAIELAASAASKGNGPFGAVLADARGALLLEAENTVHTDRDCTAHAEVNLLREAYGRFGEDRLRTCTLYTSAEPCPMCAGAVFWSGIGRLVFGLSAERLIALDPEAPQIVLSCRDVLGRGNRQALVDGPTLEEEARRVFL